MTPAAEGRRVTRDDIESKLREIRGEIDTDVEQARGTVRTVAIAGAVALVVVVYLLGRRRGRKKTTIVEIRRI